MEYPKINEVVICKVKKITNYGVFVSLLEYDELEGFVHISQISSTWIKNIHNHVKLNKIRAAKVLRIDNIKNQIDVSFSRISSVEEKRKISEYRLFLRAQALLNVIAKEMNIDEQDAWNNIAEPILEKDSDLYKGFLNVLKYGKDYYSKVKKEYRDSLFNILSKNITIKDKILRAIISVKDPSAKGIENIKKIFSEVSKDYENIQINYVSPSKYELIITAKDFKLAGQKQDLVLKDLKKKFKNLEFEFTKKEQ